MSAATSKIGPFASISIRMASNLVTPAAKALNDLDEMIMRIPSIVPLGHESSQ